LADLARADLVQAPTVITAEILLDQVQGALRAGLIRVAGWIDEQPSRAQAELEALIRRGEVGLRLLSGWRVAIAGRPNVGKSRLFNALVGFSRAIVDPTPGTTRDVVSFKAAFAGWPVELADTAGLRAAFDPVENIGIERARREQREADLIVLVLDRSTAFQPTDSELIATNRAAILVGNKSDLPPAWHHGDPALHGREIVMLSAEKGEGLEVLIDTIVRRLLPDPPPQGEAVPFRADQVNRLCQIRVSLRGGDRDRALRDLTFMISGQESHDSGT
jgi:tRNA modification GTPase